MKIAIGTPATLPIREDGIFYPGDWGLIPLGISEVLHGTFKRIIDNDGFYLMSDRSEEGIVGFDAFATTSLFVSLSEIIGAHLQIWVEDIEKNPVMSAMLGRVYSKGPVAVARIHPKQFQLLLDKKKMPKDSVSVGVACLTTGVHYSFLWRGELKLPPLEEMRQESPKVYSIR